MWGTGELAQSTLTTRPFDPPKQKTGKMNVWLVFGEVNFIYSTDSERVWPVYIQVELIWT